MTISQIHVRGTELAKQLFIVEAELIDLLQKMDEKHGFLNYGYPSLFQYAVGAWRLSESNAYCFITIARKSRAVPELKQAIDNGTLTASQGKRIASVITAENKNEWIAKAAQMKQRELEKEIVKEKPETLVRDKMKYVDETRVQLTCGISEKLMREIERVKDLVSQSTTKPCNLEGALKAMAALYLERKDPVKKAERVLSKPELSSRRVAKAGQENRKPIAAAVKHEVTRRDQGQCAHIDDRGNRCTQKRWVDIHHIKPVSDGGKDIVDNLVTLCRPHHRFQHEMRF